MPSKLTILEVTGSGDYAAMTIEDDFGVDKAYQIAKESGGKARIELEDEYDIAYVAIKEFGEVDPEFILFAQNFMDYDRSKHANFYVIDTEGDD